MSEIIISEKKRIPIPATTGGTGRALTPLAIELDGLEPGEMIEVQGASNSVVSSAANSAGKRNKGRTYSVRKLQKVVDGMQVYGVWRLQ